jgi:catechol 2,3-dioxygenase-like lactoylglutathione lyase family enzyme
MPRLLRSAPYFPVADVAKLAAYYETTLGFRIEYEGGPPGAPPVFAIVSRDGFPLMFRLVGDTSRLVPSEKQGGTWDAFFWVDDAEALCAEMRSRGAVIVYGPIIQTDYDMKEFAVRDPDGHVLGFGQDWKRT